jgi:photosystem II stability/assembly factor-like uncharacterized protein
LTIKFFYSNTGFAFREHSDLLRTTDGGVTWAKYDMGDDIYAFHFISKTIGFAAGKHGVLYRTNDGGRNWNWISPEARIYAEGKQELNLPFKVQVKMAVMRL